MDRDKIYIDTTGIGNMDEPQFTAGPNPGQFVTESNTQIDPDSKDTAFTLDDVAADSDQPAPEMQGFDRIEFAGTGFGNGNDGEPPNINGGYGNDSEPPAGGKRRHKRVESQPVNLTRSSLAAIIIICVFLSSAFGFGGAMLATNMVKPAGINNTTNADTKGFDLEDATGSEMTVQEITQTAIATSDNQE